MAPGMLAPAVILASIGVIMLGSPRLWISMELAISSPLTRAFFRRWEIEPHSHAAYRMTRATGVVNLLIALAIVFQVLWH